MSLALILVFIPLLAFGWLAREPLAALLHGHRAVLAASAGAVCLFTLILPLVEAERSAEGRRRWRERLGAEPGWQRLQGPAWSTWRRRAAAMGHPVEWLLGSLFRTRLGQWLGALWRDAGLGERPSGMVLAFVAAGALGYSIGIGLTRRPILSLFLASALVIVLAALVYRRAAGRRRRFADQLPDLLDRLADSLRAGYSLPQAIEFVQPSLLEPAASEMARVTRQIALGHGLDEALNDLLQRRPGEDLRLVVDGLILQRQLGGNIAEMMATVAGFIRGRVTLENEVRALTAQGRLSAIVIALLGPVSLALLSFFPGYLDVLWQTDTGNLVLVTAGVLEIVGAAIVSRVIRVEY